MEQIGANISANAYYLLGAKNEQYAVYHGTRFVPEYDHLVSAYTTMPINGSPIQLEKNTDTKYADYGICQMMYPVEYNIFGVGSSPVMSFKKGADGKWQKHFFVKDYLGSTRKVMKLDLNYANSAPNGVTRYAWRDGSPALASNDAEYAPYNDRNIYADRIDRLGWLGKEKDLESGLGDHGVRKYDAGSGRFLSVDPLWEKYLSWTPYQYSQNDPINYVDVNGKFRLRMSEQEQQQNRIFVSIVKDFMPTLADNKHFIKSMMDVTGVSSSKIKEFLTFGEGPIIDLQYNTSGNWNGMTECPNRIKINKYIVEDLANTNRKDYEPSTKHVAMFMISLLSHELTQALFFSNPKRKNIINPGKLFDLKFNGDEINSSNEAQKKYQQLEDAYGEVPEW